MQISLGNFIIFPPFLNKHIIYLYSLTNFWKIYINFLYNMIYSWATCLYYLCIPFTSFMYCLKTKKHKSKDLCFYLAWRRPTLTGTRSQLPSALESLTSVFGMGTGVTSLPSSPNYEGIFLQ